MAMSTNSTESIIGEDAAAYVRQCQAESAAKLAAFKALRHVDPLEFVGNRLPQIRVLLGLLAENFNGMDDVEAEDLLWLCFEMVKEIEVGIDLVATPPLPQSGGAGIDHAAHAAWREWYAAGLACQQAAEAEEAGGGGFTDPDNLFDTMATAAGRIDGTSPVAIAARLHVALDQSGGYQNPADQEHWQAAVEDILEKLAPMLPADMRRALRTPYRFIALPMAAAEHVEISTPSLTKSTEQLTPAEGGAQ